jgi:class 3 adenylate cyclase
MALDMADVVRRYPWPGDVPLQIRIGINSGPVVAGVIGVRKFIYDLWGDTVNTASRMESTGVIGAIQVTEATHELLVHDYEFEERGTIDVKGKGTLHTYLLVGRKPNRSRESRREVQTAVVSFANPLAPTRDA